jgi:hypothetical protein
MPEARIPRQGRVLQLYMINLVRMISAGAWIVR